MEVNQMRNRPAISLLSWLPANGKLRGVVAGAILATGMTALAAPPPARAPQRAAWLLPPQKLEPGDVPAIARGAIDDLPSATIGSTPVVRSGKKSSESPAWLTGVDPNVLPASGLLPSRSTSEVRTLGGSTSIPPLTPGRSQTTASAASPVPSSIAKPYVPFPQASDKSTATERAEAQLDPSTPLKGTAANGAPLLAGPPAYRWYGYGSVTPGANAFAPAGQYPRASSNWYSVTGATPGAFPVPVMNPYRSAPGNEPPQYTLASPGSAGIPPASAQPPRQFAETVQSNGRDARTPRGISPAPSNFSRTPGNAGISPMPSIGSIGTGSAPAKLPLPPLPQPVGVPQMAAPPAMPAPSAASITPASDSPKAPILPEPVGLIPSVDPAPLQPEAAIVVPPTLPARPLVEAKKPVVGLPVVAIKAAGHTVPSAPEALPPALTDDMNWNPTPEPARVVPPGTWLPATTPGAMNAKPTTLARGQMPDANRADPVATLIQGMCRGRAEGIDVRWTASKKLTVCFEVRSQPDATRLVRDISARQELAAYGIDFCVLVK